MLDCTDCDARPVGKRRRQIGRTDLGHKSSDLVAAANTIDPVENNARVRIGRHK
jgi:hypothetical protein